MSRVIEIEFHHQIDGGSGRKTQRNLWLCSKEKIVVHWSVDPVDSGNQSL